LIVRGLPKRSKEKCTTQKTGSFVVYGAGENQIPILDACRRKGWRVIAIDRNPASAGSALADRFVCVSLRDHDAIERALENEVVCGAAARVTDRFALDSCRRLSLARGLAAPCEDLLAASTSKVWLAEVCRVVGLRTPERFADPAAIDFEAGPVILRPDVTTRGKAGIYRVGSSARLTELRDRTATESANAQVDLSRWVEGFDVSVLAQLSVGVAKRLAIWDEWVAIDPEGRIAGMGAGFPSVFEGHESAIDETLDALAAGFPESNCLITLSLRIDRAGSPWIIEIHLGIGGDGLADQLIPAALPGLNVFDALVDVSAGRALAPSAPRARPCGLLRDGKGWELIAAGEAETIRARARGSVPADWELPLSLCETCID
jgi:hypothetical protein